MNYLRSLGLAVLAALSVMAFMGAGVASASEPIATPNPVGFPVAFTGVGGTGTLETTPDSGGAVHKVHCTASSSSGELSSASTTKTPVVRFTGCTDPSTGANCKSTGAAANEIVTNKLHGTLVYLETGKSRTGVLLKPETGTTFAAFTCVAIFGITAHLSVTGEVLGELTPVNVQTKDFTLTFKKAAGHPIPSSYLNPTGCAHVSTTDALKASSTGASVWGPLTSGLEGSQTLTFSKEVKIDATSCS